MKLNEAPPFRPRLTLRQMMKLVLFAAVGSAVAAPLRLLAPPSMILLWSGVAVPLSWALLAFVLVRKGSVRDWLIQALLTVSVMVAFGTSIYFGIIYTDAVGRQASQGMAADYSTLATIYVVFVALGFALLFLLRRVVPSRCPECQRVALLPDANPAARVEGKRHRVYQCLGCGARFWRSNESWMSSDLYRPPSATAHSPSGGALE